jgi:hypothetical protein
MLYRLGSHSASYRRRPAALRERRRSRLRVEELESRTLLSVFTPADIRLAYGFAQAGLTGAGQTIALIDAYGNPTIAQSLHQFDRQFGLPDPVLTTAAPQGQPAFDSGWAGETALDVEWAHAVAPQANILLVQAGAPTLDSLFGAVQYASQQPGVSVVSMSWGTGEFAGETAYDHYFTTPGITYVASSGDSGAWFGADYPAASPNVVSVGGTALSVSAGGTYAGESAWGGSGGGISQFESEPAYQQGVQQTGARTVPDLAYNASPGSGYAVYDAANGGWQAAAGTSAGAPQWAGLIALANQGRAAAGQAPLDGAGQTLPALYQMAGTSYGTYFHDVTSGGNGYGAAAGYDLATGLGSPQAAAVIQALVGASGSGAGLTLGKAATSTPTISHTLPTSTRTPRSTRNAHRHNVLTTSPGPGNVPPVSGTAPVGQGTNAARATAPTAALPNQTSIPPVAPVSVAAGTPAVAGSAGQVQTAAPVSPATVPPTPIAHTTAAAALNGGGGQNAAVPTEEDDGGRGRIIPDLSVPDVVPDLVPPGTRVADGAGAPAGPAVGDAYFLEPAAPTAAEETAPAIGESVVPLGGAGLALLLGGLWGEGRRADGERARERRAGR